MLAPNHVLLATSITFAGSIALDRAFFLPFIVFVVVASLLPDIDHQGSEMSKLIPIINLAFPHRGVTHSVFAVIVFGVLMYLLSDYYQYFSVILGVLSVMGLYFIEKIATKKIFTQKNPLMMFFTPLTTQVIVRLFVGVMSVFLFLAMILVWNDVYRSEIVTLLVIGYAAHLLGDWVTRDGIPLLWPFRTRLGLRLFRTGGVVEGIISVGLVVINCIALWQFVTYFGVSEQEYWNNYIRWVV